ncbi:MULTISPECIES: ATP-binding protein [unclassified Streptomyces]|uniref:ATP-binding protein n=1 Tax=unclassified Streptomyces TaxID=2593676 RepID=UPI0035D5C224
MQRDDLAARDARAVVGMVLAVWHLDRLREDATLVVTELAANAARHARGAVVRLTMTRTGSESGACGGHGQEQGPSPAREGEPLAESGRGLRLVDAMSTRWGVIPLNSDKQVWAEVESA